MQNREVKAPDLSLVMPEGIGERIRIIRRAANLTQTQLAEALGVVQQSVSAWERGWTLPGVETLWAFCKLTGVSADLVLGIGIGDNEGSILAAGRIVHEMALGQNDAAIAENKDEDEGPYCCPVARCMHNTNGDCKTNGVGCYL